MMPRRHSPLFLATLLAATGLLWLTPYLPMIDLPQHAGQVRLLHDLLTGTSPWQSQVQIVWLTPYLAGYVPAALLSWLLPVHAAMAAMLSAALVLWVLAWQALRRRVDADPRLDWLILPGFFGFAFGWGFFTFLVAAPLGVCFLLLAERDARAPGTGSGLLLAAASGGLLFAHGLVFAFANMAGVLMACGQRRGWPGIRRLLPYGVGGLTCVLFFLADHSSGQGFDLKAVKWGFSAERLMFPLYTVLTSTRDIDFVAVLLLLAWAPRWLECRLQRDRPLAWMPLLAVLLVALSWPSGALQNSAVYQRFALFLLPAYALVFRAPGDDRASPPRAGSAYLLPVLCWAVLLGHGLRILAFDRETADWTAVAAQAEPQQLALGLVLDRDSPAANDPVTYLHFFAWYQAEQGGLVDYNFAQNRVQLIHYRPGQAPAADEGFNHHPWEFDWFREQGRRYRYIFVRSRARPDALFAHADCTLTLRAQSGAWWLYQREACR